VRIRSQLAILVIAVMAPVAVLAGFAIEQLWSLQRKAYEQQFLERVSALRLALDTDLEATVRTLRTLSEAPDLDEQQRLPAFTERFRRLLQHNPGWATIRLVQPDGAPIARLDKRPLPAEATLDAATLAKVTSSRDVAISGLISTADDKSHLTYIAVPVLRGGAPKAVFYIGIDHAGWLAFLQRYPISEKATLTLQDRDGRIIARTLNNERWVGRQSAPAFMERIRGRSEGAFINAGLEGQMFYSAFSNSRTSGWLLGTGVPQADVEAALRGPTAALVAAVLVAAALAVFFALFFGRRITGALTSLASAARATAGPAAAASGQRLAIDEAETVRRALEESASQLRMRESSLNEALQGEGRARAEAERASKAKDEFLAMLGHELRNPLSAISSAAQLLELAQDKPDVAQRAREMLQRQLHHLTGIIDDMLDVARLTSGKVMLNRQLLDLAEVARHVVDSFRDAGRSAHVELVAYCAAAPVFADETRLEQVITNLLDNACKYSPPGSYVWLQVAADEGHAVLTVRDNGSGIAPELLPHVFDIFSQGPRSLERAEGGLGLGLTVVRRLVELHGGSISAASDGPDRGATFVVRLPRAADVVQGAAAGERSGALAPKRIVLVEDNADSRESLAALLRMMGHEVSMAANGRAGVSEIVASSPDIALIDLGLPGLDGLQVAREVRARMNGERVFLMALTGYGGEGERRRALDAGFDAFLIKPFESAKFEAAARAATKER
jgi:signal transduction histidine kinase/ActR/RegA family two-component response regulator